jgi:hypothetical protein
MHFFVGFLFYLFLFVALLALAVVFALWFYVYRFFKRRKQKRKLRLEYFQKRSAIVVAELLREANEIDEAINYVGKYCDEQWHRDYSDALKRLLDCADKLKESEKWISMKELNAAEETILYVVRQSHMSEEVFRKLKPSEVEMAIYTEAIASPTAKVAEDSASYGAKCGEAPGTSIAGSGACENVMKTGSSDGDVLKIKDKGQEIQQKRGT